MPVSGLEYRPKKFKENMWSFSCLCYPETGQIYVTPVVIISKTKENYQAIQN